MKQFSVLASPVCSATLPLTQHDFISCDDCIEFEGIRHDFAFPITIVELVLVNQTSAVCTESIGNNTNINGLF